MMFEQLIKTNLLRKCEALYKSNISEGIESVCIYLKQNFDVTFPRINFMIRHRDPEYLLLLFHIVVTRSFFLSQSMTVSLNVTYSGKFD